MLEDGTKSLPTLASRFARCVLTNSITELDFSDFSPCFPKSKIINRSFIFNLRAWVLFINNVRLFLDNVGAAFQWCHQ